MDLVHLCESGIHGYFAKSSTNNPGSSDANFLDLRHSYTSYTDLNTAGGYSDRLQIRDEVELEAVLANYGGRLGEYIGLGKYLSPKVCVKGPNMKGLGKLWRSYMTEPELPLPVDYSARLVTSNDDFQPRGPPGEKDGSEDLYATTATEIVIQPIEAAH